MKFFATLLLLFTFHTFAQKGVLPFSGLTYEYRGLSAKEIVTELDEATWTSNRLPINTDFEIKMIEPAGFTIVDGRYYPGIEVAMLNTAGDTLGYIPDIMAGDDFEGFEEFSLKKLSLTLGFNELSHPGDTLLIHARFFDQNSENELITTMLVIIADSELPLETTWSTHALTGNSSAVDYKAIATGLELESFTSAHLKNKKVPYDTYSIRIDSLKGMEQQEWLAGTKSVWYYTEKLEQRSIQEEKCTFTLAPSADKSASGTLVVNVPLTRGTEMRYIRVRWENEDHSKVLDIVTEIKN